MTFMKDDDHDARARARARAVPTDAAFSDRVRLCFSLYAAQHAFNRLYAPLLADLGLTYPQYLVMAALWEEDGRSVGALGELLHLASNTLTPLLKRLEAADLIRRVRSESDERVVIVTLTDAGAALATQAEMVPCRVLGSVDMSPAEAARLAREIDALREALERAGGG
ncbi:MAG: MarR family transcriptional regulator [Pseudomonadota bacterium]